MLLELLVGLAVTGIIISGLVTALFQLERGFDRGNTQTTLNRAVDNAMLWIGDDVIMAKTITGSGCSSPPGTCFQLKWTEYYNGANTSHTITYALDASQNLTRTLDANPAQTVGTGITAITYSASGRQVTVTLTDSATSWIAGTLTETSSYVLYMRGR